MRRYLKADDDDIRSKFKALRDRSDVATLLEVDPPKLDFCLGKGNVYREFSIKKRSGGVRKICSPGDSLRFLQQRLGQVLLTVYGRRAPAHAYTREKSIRSNAVAHLGCSGLLNIDLEDFFPSIHFGRILGLFKSYPYVIPHAAAMVLARICTYQGKLPIGAPTSPVVANMVCAAMDAQLKVFARSNRCFYTRYADDITFSTRDKQFSPAVVTVGPGSRT